jgi:predicted RNA-binding Zn-ribbon protein involved in translation (DUF1610 family)
LQDRLILVDVDPPLYEQAQRCRCTECKNLFDLSEHTVIARAQCPACGKPIFERTQLQKIWKGAETLLQRARKLDRALRQVPACAHCGQPGTAKSWCPLHDSSATPGPTGGLPQNATLVWVRTFHTAESLEELQQQEWWEGESELEIEPERESETEPEIERETESEDYDA